MFLVLSGMDIFQMGLIFKLAESIFGYCNNILLKSFFDLPNKSEMSLFVSSFQTILTLPDKLKFIFLTSANEIFSLLDKEKVKSSICGM